MKNHDYLPVCVLSEWHINKIQQKIEQLISLWCKRHKFYPIMLESIGVFNETIYPEYQSGHMYYDGDKPLIWFSTSCLSLLTQTAFNDHDPALYPFTEKLLTGFLLPQTIIKQTQKERMSLCLQNRYTQTCYFMLKSMQKEALGIIHPLWIMTFFQTKKHRPTINLPSLLAQKKIELSLHYPNFSLPLKALNQLQKECVLKTDFSSQTPLILSQKNHVVGRALLGQNKQNFCIQLTQ